MTMKQQLIIATMALSVLMSCAGKADGEYNQNYMWFDCEANYETLSYPDSIRYYLTKCKELGFDNVVVDVKSIMGEVLYERENV